MNYLQELHKTARLVDGMEAEKAASDASENADERSITTDECQELASGLLKMAADMREDAVARGAEKTDAETTEVADDVTGIKEEEVKRRLLEKLRKAKKSRGREAAGQAPEAGREGGMPPDVAAEEKAAADYVYSPGKNSPAYPEEARKLDNQIPDEELTESDLKNALKVFAKNKMKGGEKSKGEKSKGEKKSKGEEKPKDEKKPEKGGGYK